MRRIEITTAFKRDYRRVRASPRHRDIEVLLSRILDLLVADDPLPARYHDHPLTGDTGTTIATVTSSPTSC